MRKSTFALGLLVFVALGMSIPALAQTAKSSKTLTGCLSGPNDEGVYVLQTKSGKVELGGSDDLKNHVGHEIKVSGKLASGSQIGEKEENEAKENKAMEKKESASEERNEMREEKGERHFKVSNIQMVSDTCSTK